MSADLSQHLVDLPIHVGRALQDFIAAAQLAFGDRLRSAVLFGSAAEGRLRPTSDVNLILVLTAFERADADRMREPLRLAHAAALVEPMWLLEREIAPATESFAVKFADVLRRRRVLVGPDPFAGVSVSRAAEIARLRQVTLNLTLRWREQYVLRSLREEQARGLLADAAGPLRACAAALLDLEGTPADSARAALEQVCARLGGAFAGLPARLSDARQDRPLAAGEAPDALFTAAELAAALHDRATRLR